MKPVSITIKCLETDTYCYRKHIYNKYLQEDYRMLRQEPLLSLARQPSRYARAGNAPLEARISATARSQLARRSGPAGWVSSMPVSLRPVARAIVTRRPRALSRSTFER